ncbi:BURP domain-containing protein [Cynara cardunculus var. scolymus]|uniref:BURP domain-containing protein n=1 Tax=Cynara cardunculus var. scolymus TaxID=59895 RepID=A0A118K0W9_CYNCS|nr:BURP domain-containing protein [Cynara cardunculus var. scolymus]
MLYCFSSAQKIIEENGGAHRELDPALNVFFRVNDLYLGKKMMIYFAGNDNFAHTRLLSRDEADSIHFSSSKLPYLLDFFKFSKESPQAKAMETTLKQCELKSKGGEIKFCATSLESMLDMARGVLGVVKPKVLTTKILNSNHTLFQRYTFMEKPMEIYAPKMMACHTMAYPYLVYYCHGQKGHFNRVFKIALRGENGERVEGVGICHMDTSTWDPDHVAFQVLGGQPGSSPVCHFLPVDNLVWLSST